MPPSPSALPLLLDEALERLGGHPCAALGLDPERPADRARWLLAARLLSERAPEETALRAFRRLDAEVGSDPGALAAAGPGPVAAALEGAGLRRADSAAGGLCRIAAALRDPAGDLEGLAAEALDTNDLGARIAALAPGLGAATVLRFLRPLRDVWGAARETPLAPTATAAAAHLGLGGADAEGEPAALRARCAELAPGRAWTDVEAALERLGARACRAGRTGRCPLGDACPARAAAEA